MKSAPSFVITRLDTRALQVMRGVEVDFSEPPTLDVPLDDYALDLPTTVLPRPMKIQAMLDSASLKEVHSPSPARRSLAKPAKRSRLSWVAVISVTASMLTFVILACVAALSG